MSGYEITLAPDRFDLEAIHAFLSRSYWAERIPRETVREAGMRVLGYVGMATAQSLLEAGAHEVFDDMADVPRLLGLPAA